MKLQSRFAVLLATLAVLVGAAFSQVESPSSKMLGAMDRDWQGAVAAWTKLSVLPQEAKQNPVFTARLAVLSAKRDTVAKGTHGCIVQWIQYDKELAIYEEERKRHALQAEAYRKDKEAYMAAGGGGTYKTDDPKYGMLVAWYQRLNAAFNALERLREKQDRDKKALDDFHARISRENTAFLKEWSNECAVYVQDATRYGAVAEIDIAMEKLEVQLARDKRALEGYRDRLPGLHADIEKMALEADETREEGMLVAIDNAMGMAVDELIAKTGAREMLKRNQLRQTKQTMINAGVRPEHVKKLLKGWFDQPNSVPTIRTQKQLLEQFATFRDVAASLDKTLQKKYLEALASCLKTFVKTPIFKLAITNAEVYLSLVHTGLSYAAANARVKQYAKLADADLKAISAISKTYQKHIKQMAELKKQREDRLRQLDATP